MENPDQIYIFAKYKSPWNPWWHTTVHIYGVWIISIIATNNGVRKKWVKGNIFWTLGCTAKKACPFCDVGKHVSCFVCPGPTMNGVSVLVNNHWRASVTSNDRVGRHPQPSPPHMSPTRMMDELYHIQDIKRSHRHMSSNHASLCTEWTIPKGYS